MTPSDEQIAEAVIAAILMTGAKGSAAYDQLEISQGTYLERAILTARRLLVLAQAKTIVPEEHP
jgi:hypothetical protein